VFEINKEFDHHKILIASTEKNHFIQILAYPGLFCVKILIADAFSSGSDQLFSSEIM